MSKEHIVPIHEAHTDRINAHGLELPPYLRGKIGMDLAKTTKLMNIGGISHLHILSNESREKAEPTIVGYDQGGSAYAGKVKTKTQIHSNNETQDLKDGKTKARHWRAITLTVNTQTIADSLSEKNNDLSAHAWTKPLNKEVKGAITKAGTTHSLNPSSQAVDYVTDFIIMGSLYFLINDGKFLDFTEATRELAYFAPLYLRNVIFMPDPQYRGDILYSSFVGRAALLNLRANTNYRNLVVQLDK